MPKKAIKIIEDHPRYVGVVDIYKLDPPYFVGKEKIEYVAVSTADVMFSSWETYIFPCDINGDVTDWVELKGSFRGGGMDIDADHKRALEGLGYEEV